MSDDATESSLFSSSVFQARPYRPCGGFSLNGLVILTAIICLAGALVGFLAGFIGHYFFVIVLYPIVMGFVIGAAGAFGVKTGRVRRPIVCGIAGLLGSCVSVAVMHFTAYYQFESGLKNVPQEIREVARNLNQAKARLKEFPRDVQDAINKLSRDEESRRALAVDGLFSFIDYRARQGVEIGRMRRGRKPPNLGYTGSYVYWGCELLVIAGLAFGVMQGASGEPFCARCDNWKSSEPLGTFHGSHRIVRAALEGGDLAAILNDAGAIGDKLRASVFNCPQCEGQAEIDVRIEWITQGDKGEESISSLCTVTYPGEALASVREVFAAVVTASERADAFDADDPAEDGATDADEQQNA